LTGTDIPRAQPAAQPTSERFHRIVAAPVKRIQLAVRSITQDSLCSQHRPEPHFIAVEFAQFSIAKEDAVDFFIHLFEPDLFVSEYFAYKNPALVPTDISTVVHSPRLKRP
jgi:hypothetical protein